MFVQKTGEDIYIFEGAKCITYKWVGELPPETGGYSSYGCDHECDCDLNCDCGFKCFIDCDDECDRDLTGEDDCGCERQEGPRLHTCGVDHRCYGCPPEGVSLEQFIVDTPGVSFAFWNLVRPRDFDPADGWFLEAESKS